MQPLETQLEAVLFYKGETTLKELSKLLSRTNEEIEEGLKSLSEALFGRGITLVRVEDKVALSTANDHSALIEQIRKDELQKDIGKAGSEILAIILYKGPVSRAQIDYIRGVNSQASIRNLLIRGLVEKVTNPNDARSYLYKPTLELLSFLGISSVQELPEYAAFIAELSAIEKKQEEEEVIEDIHE